MSERFTLTVNCLMVFCAECSRPIGLLVEEYERRVKDGKGFYCPAMHKNSYSVPINPLAELLQKEQERRAALAELLEKETKRADECEAKTKTVITAGLSTCPKCQRRVRSIKQHDRAMHSGVVQKTKPCPKCGEEQTIFGCIKCRAKEKQA